MFNNKNNRVLIYDTVKYKLYHELDDIISLVRKSDNFYYSFSSEDGNYILNKLRSNQIEEVNEMLSIYDPFLDVPTEDGIELEEKYLLDL